MFRTPVLPAGIREVHLALRSVCKNLGRDSLSQGTVKTIQRQLVNPRLYTVERNLNKLGTSRWFQA